MRVALDISKDIQIQRQKQMTNNKSEFDWEMLDKYLVQIGCSSGQDRRFNKVWEVFACFVAHKCGFDSDFLLAFINSGPRGVYGGFKTLSVKSDGDLAALVGVAESEIQPLVNTFVVLFA